MTQYVILSPDTTKVITWFYGPQAAQTGYAEIEDTDPRYLAYEAANTASAAVQTALTSSITITSTGTSALNGTYAVDPATQQKIIAEAVYIQVTGGIGVGNFTNGQSTRGWPDITGTPHTFDTTHFVPFAEAVAQYVDALVSWSGSGSLPAASATIA